MRVLGRFGRAVHFAGLSVRSSLSRRQSPSAFADGSRKSGPGHRRPSVERRILSLTEKRDPCAVETHGVCLSYPFLRGLFNSGHISARRRLLVRMRETARPPAVFLRRVVLLPFFSIPTTTDWVECPHRGSVPDCGAAPRPLHRIAAIRRNNNKTDFMTERVGGGRRLLGSPPASMARRPSSPSESE